jgi:hypothetical protein
MQLERRSITRAVYEVVLPFTLLLVCVIAGIFLRVVHVQEPLWLDEVHTVWVVDGTWNEIEQRAIIGNQSPLYFWLVKAASYVPTNSSELSVRLVSLCFGILLIPLAFLCAWRWSGSAAIGCLFCATVSCDPFFVFYSTEARPYVVLQFITLLQLMCLRPLLVGNRHAVGGHPEKRRVIRIMLGWTVLSICGVYFHYTFCFMVIVQLSWLLERTVSLANRYLRYCVLLSICALIGAIAPVGWHMAEIWERRFDWGSAIQFDQAWLEFRPTFFVSMAMPLWALIGFNVFEKRLENSVIRKTVWPLLIGMAFAIVYLAAANLYDVTGLLMLRYQQPVLVLILLAFSCLPASFRHSRFFIPICLLLMTSTFFAHRQPMEVLFGYKLSVYRNEQWNLAANSLSATVGLNEQIILAPGLVEDHLLNSPHTESFEAYCKFPLYRLTKLPQFEDSIHVVSSGEPLLNRKLIEQIGRDRQLTIVTRGGLENASRLVGAITEQLEPGETDKPSVSWSVFGDVTITKVTW